MKIEVGSVWMDLESKEIVEIVSKRKTCGRGIRQIEYKLVGKFDNGWVWNDVPTLYCQAKIWRKEFKPMTKAAKVLFNANK